jgi:hypothetical protein
MLNGWPKIGCGGTIIIGPTRPLAVYRRGSYYAGHNIFYLCTLVWGGACPGVGLYSFHFSVDDVLPALVEVTDKEIPLIEHPFFYELRYIYEKYGVKTGLNLFYSHVIDGERRYLYEVRDLKEELLEGWLYFAPHALDFDTAPYAQNTSEQRAMVNNIVSEIDRIAEGFRASSVRFHYYSECFEIAKSLIDLGFNEIFVTDKSMGSHRLPRWQKDLILRDGNIMHKGLKVARTNFRIEDLANEQCSDEKLLQLFSDNLVDYSRVVIYSHEYEHVRDEVNVMLKRTMNILVGELGLSNECP